MKKKIVSLGLIGIILLSVVSFSLFFGPKKVTPAELVDLVFEKYDFKLNKGQYECIPKPNVKESDLEQEFAVVGVIWAEGSNEIGLNIKQRIVLMKTEKKINDNLFLKPLEDDFLLSFSFYHIPHEKDHKITEKNWKFFENIHKGEKIKIKFKLKNIDIIHPLGIIIFRDGYFKSTMTVEKY